MNKPTVGFIGGGRVARIFLEGWTRTNELPVHVVVADPNDGTLVDSGLPPSEVMDLVPVKPLAEMEPQVLEFYRSRLPALFEKIRP
jgi:hypothetical protein